MVTRILSFDIPNAFLKSVGEESPFITAGAFFGLGIAITALEQVEKKNNYEVNADSRNRISRMVSLNIACLAVSMISSLIACRYENATLAALVAVSVGGAFWSIRQIRQINSIRQENLTKVEIDFAAKRNLLGLVTMFGLPCILIGKLALSYHMSQRV